MIQQTRGLLLTGILTVAIALITMFPARVAYQVASPPFVAMSGIRGTIWSGSAREFSTNGVYLRNLTWKIRPLRLLIGKAVYVVSGSPASGFLDSEIAIGLGGTVTMHNLNASVPLQMFEKAAGIPGLRGTASLQFKRLQLINGRAVAMEGSMDVTGLTLASFSNFSLGGYRAEFFTQNNGIVASVEDTDGVVDLAGSLQLNPDKTYAFLGQVIAKSDTPESLTRLVARLPSTNDRGQHELRLEGSY